MSIILECIDVHKIRLDARADLFAELTQNVEATVVHVGPQVEGSLFGDEVEEAADGWGGVAHEADCCVGTGSWSVERGA